MSHQCFRCLSYNCEHMPRGIHRLPDDMQIRLNNELLNKSGANSEAMCSNCRQHCWACICRISDPAVAYIDELQMTKVYAYDRNTPVIKVIRNKKLLLIRRK